MSFLIRFLVVAGAVYLLAMLVPGVRIKNFKTAMGVAAVYGILNWVLFKLLIFITFPLVALKYLTLGVFAVVINGVLLVITDKLMEDFEMKNLGAVILMALGIGGVNLLLAFSRF